MFAAGHDDLAGADRFDDVELAEHADGSYFPEKTERLLAELGDRPAREICNRLREDLLSAGSPQDDVSVVVIRKTA